MQVLSIHITKLVKAAEELRHETHAILAREERQVADRE